MAETARRPSVSNIAWPAENDSEALALVAELGFEGLELAPAKVFGDPFKIGSADLRAYRNRVTGYGLEISALQGILFGSQDAHLFKSDASRRIMSLHLARIAELASELGARACVFGAPTLRDPGDLPIAAAHQIAIDFFAKIADIYSGHGVALCLEANPPLYNCRFITRTAEALALVETVDRPGLALQLDTGTIFLNGEDPGLIVSAALRIGHFHVSEPSLVPIGTAAVDHAPLAAALKASAYTGWISVEMKSVAEWRQALRQAYEVVTQAYTGDDGSTAAVTTAQSLSPPSTA